MDKIAVLGDRESVLGFLALGLEVRPAETAQEGREALRELEREAVLGPYSRDEVYIVDMERFHELSLK